MIMYLASRALPGIFGVLLPLEFDTSRKDLSGIAKKSTP